MLKVAVFIVVDISPPNISVIYLEQGPITTFHHVPCIYSLRSNSLHFTLDEVYVGLIVDNKLHSAHQTNNSLITHYNKLTDKLPKRKTKRKHEPSTFNIPILQFDSFNDDLEDLDDFF